MKASSVLMVVLASFGFVCSGYCEYRTADSGIDYYLSGLVAESSGVLEQSGSDFILRDKLFISPSDRLLISGERILVATRQEGLTPRIVIEGSLEADGLIMESVPEAVDVPTFSTGFQITGLGHSGPAEAIITNSTFSRLISAISVRGGGHVTITSSSFFQFERACIMAYAEGKLTVRDSSIDSSIFASNAKVDIDNCQIVGPLLLETSPGNTSVTDCDFVDGLIGLYSFGESEGLIQNNLFQNLEYGAFFSGYSNLNFLNNTLNGNARTAVVVEQNSAPTIRDNVINHDPGEDPSNVAALILDNATPDLGTVEDPGGNSIDCQEGLCLYHAGVEPVYAIGNDWGVPLEQFDSVVYYKVNDLTDDDGSEFSSGYIYNLNPAGTQLWMMYR